MKIKFNKNILGVVARAGWGTISNSIILNKPLIIFPYSEGDDPEIFFNVETLKKLDIAAIYASDLSFGENMDVAISKIPNMIKFKENILSRYGTLDGSKYCAEVMYFDMLNVDRFLRFSDKEAL
ncbi:MAG: glycosyltransferase [Candidatus Nanoarchaeia archaeon]|nr:glycosyltransferase [Candidatus Nanoarchaeia archaeon]